MTRLTWLLWIPMLAWGEGAGDLRALDDTHTKTRFAAPHYGTLAEWRERREHLKKQILASAGLWPLRPREAPAMREFGRVDGGAYTVARVAFETLPGFWVGANLYLPKRPAAGTKLPAVLVPHGHWKNGRVEDNDDYSVPALCVNLAAQGYVALAYDMVGYNDTRQLPHSFGDSARERAWMFHPLGVQLWNSLRAMDLLSAHPLVDAARIAVTGASGGGTQTFLLAAVDERVAVSMPAAMVSATFQGDDDCEVAPGLRVGTNNIEIAAMAAPRPQLLLSATGDWTSQTPELEYPAVRGIYRLYGATAAVQNAHVDAGHNYNRQSREAAYAFLWRHLAKRSGAAPRETVEFTLKPEELLIGPAIEQLTHGVGRDEVFAAWRARAMEARKRVNAAQRRELLRATLALHWPERVQEIPFRGAFILEAPEVGARAAGRWLPGGKAVTLVVDHDGAEAGAESAAAKEAKQRGDTVLAIGVFEPSAEAQRQRRGDYLTFHRSDQANRVQDVMTALAYATTAGSAPVRLACSRRAEIWCAIALAAAPAGLPIRVAYEVDADQVAEFAERVAGFELAWGAESLLNARAAAGINGSTAKR